MQIITIEDTHFPDLLGAWRDAQKIGSFTKDGKLQLVAITKHFVLILTDTDRSKISIKPARNITEAQQLAISLLEREKLRGNSISLEDVLTTQ
jgi:hypothetical protein